jgi:hypothetical protein
LSFGKPVITDETVFYGKRFLWIEIAKDEKYRGLTGKPEGKSILCKWSVRV